MSRRYEGQPLSSDTSHGSTTPLRACYARQCGALCIARTTNLRRPPSPLRTSGILRLRREDTTRRKVKAGRAGSMNGIRSGSERCLFQARGNRRSGRNLRNKCQKDLESRSKRPAWSVRKKQLAGLPMPRLGSRPRTTSSGWFPLFVYRAAVVGSRASDSAELIAFWCGTGRAASRPPLRSKRVAELLPRVAINAEKSASNSRNPRFESKSRGHQLRMRRACSCWDVRTKTRSADMPWRKNRGRPRDRGREEAGREWIKRSRTWANTAATMPCGLGKNHDYCTSDHFHATDAVR